MSEKEDFDNFFDTLSEKVKRNVTVVTPSELFQDYHLHISKNITIKEFIPAISNRQGGQEDRTVPRVTVAPTLLGCIIGYVATISDFHSIVTPSSMKDKVKPSDYRGGYCIYELPFTYSLKPSARLVYDSRISDEYWLVSYNEKTAHIVPKTAGKFFYRSINYVSSHDKSPEADITIYCEILKEEGIHFSKNHFLTKGFWVIEGPLHTEVSNWADDKDFKVKEIDANEFKNVKVQCAALLSNTEVPMYMRW